MSDLGQALKDSRNEAGFSQTEVADEIHVSRQSISKWENNTQMPDISRVRDLCRLYGVSMDDLMDRIDDCDEGTVEYDIVVESRKGADTIVDVPDSTVGTQDKNVKQPYDDGALLLVLAGLCSFVPILDLIAPWLIMWKNKKTNRYYWWINGICVITFLVALGTYALAYVMSDKYM